MKKILYIIAAGAILLASCSKENSSPNVDDTAVKFSTEITTRASGTAWDNGDAIGVFMLTAGDNISTSEGLNASNVNYTYTAGSFSTATSIYYPQAGNVDFVAYYPWRTTPASTPYIYKVDVSTQATPANIDLLWSANAKGKSRSKTAVALTFDHKLSRVVLNIKAGTGMTDADLAGVTVKITGMPTKADFALATGTFNTPIDIANITPRTVAAGTTYDAILIPQTGTTGRKMVFTVGTDVYEHSIPSNDDFLSGKSYAYIVTVSKTGVSVSRGTITDWTTTTPEPVTPIQMPAMVLIPAGTFQMGSPNSDGEARSYEKPQHYVKLTQDFYMSKYQITNAQYAAFLNAKSIGDNGEGSVTYNKDGNPATGTHDFIDDHRMGVKWDNASSKWIPALGKDNHPVIYVTWYGAKAYADWIGGSLPTEAQWEYACRGGTATIYSYGPTANSDYMWYLGNNDTNGETSGTKAVGRKLPNAWGLYDMHGNVYEWCLDQWDGSNNYPIAETEGNAVENPLATAGTTRVLRGGRWISSAQNCRSAVRGNDNPAGARSNVGIRVVFVP